MNHGTSGKNLGKPILENEVQFEMNVFNVTSKTDRNFLHEAVILGDNLSTYTTRVAEHHKRFPQNFLL